MPMNNKLKAIIYNTKPRDDYSLGVYDHTQSPTKSCEYIFGGLDQPDWFYCGHPTHERSVYCAEHHALCYTRKRRKVKNA